MAETGAVVLYGYSTGWSTTPTYGERYMSLIGPVIVPARARSPI